MKKIPRKFEKVDEHTIRIIFENTDDIPVDRLLANEKQLEERKAQLEGELKRVNDVLGNINEMLEEAKKLGLTPAPKKETKK